MQILLLGKDGQVGHELKSKLLTVGRVHAIGRDECDLEDLETLQNILEQIQPNLIVNAAAYTKVDLAETEIEQAFILNAKIVEVLACYAFKSQALLIHYSTDYVFDGQKVGPYTEKDLTSPLNIYGKSKLTGEQAIQQSQCNYLIFRTTWVYSFHGHNFIKTILKLAQTKTSLNVVNDQYGAPTSASLIATVTILAINAYMAKKLNNGLYHLSAAGVTTWYGLAIHTLNVAKSYGLNLTLDAAQVKPIVTAEYPLPAVRPVNSCLDSSLLLSVLDIDMPQWQVGVDKMLDQLLMQQLSLNHDDCLLHADKLVTNKQQNSGCKNLNFQQNMLIRLEKISILIQRAFYVAKTQGLFFCCKKIPMYIIRLLSRKIASRKAQKNLQLLLSKLQNTVTTTPMVSFIIPIYNRTDVLREAIKSALAQTYLSIEVILITDGSPPETLAVVNEFAQDPRIKIFHFPTSSGNAVRGRNKGILEAEGKYIAFLDSDDIATKDRVLYSLSLLEENLADVVYGGWQALLDGTREIDGLVNGQVVYSPDCDLDLLLKVCVPCQSTVMVRKSFFYKAGFLKHNMQYREDHELWTRLAVYGAKFRSIPQVLVHLRLHSGNNELNFKKNDSYWQNQLLCEYKIPAKIPKKIAFIVDGLGCGGGTIVIMRYANFLMSQGHDVQIINVGNAVTGEVPGNTNIVPIIDLHAAKYYLFGNIDLLFATFWTTCQWLEKIPAKRKIYFVQSDERLFYDTDLLKQSVANTYRLSGCEYVTVSNWIVRMLKQEFNQNAKTIPNGIDCNVFYPCRPLVPKNPNKLRILLEGPLSIPFKGVVDAYSALDGINCEIWLVTSDGYPDPSWRIDKLFHNVAFADMPAIYSSCDILLKMSRVESFSYPPLEAMACGCAVVVGEVSGDIEYVEHEVNALVVNKQDVIGANGAIKRLIADNDLYMKLINNGYKTAQQWTLERSFNSLISIIDLVKEEQCLEFVES